MFMSSYEIIEIVDNGGIIKESESVISGEQNSTD
jgi:hypothetical protein